MADDRSPDNERRRDETNQDNRNTTMGESRRMMNEKIIDAFEDVGIEAGSREGQRNHVRLLEAMRDLSLKTEETNTTLRYAEKMRQRESEIDRALQFVGDQMKRRNADGTEMRKSVISAVASGVISAILAALAAVFALGHRP